jgi:hypothetical protein
LLLLHTMCIYIYCKVPERGRWLSGLRFVSAIFS